MCFFHLFDNLLISCKYMVDWYGSSHHSSVHHYHFSHWHSPLSWPSCQDSNLSSKCTEQQIHLTTQTHSQLPDHVDLYKIRTESLRNDDAEGNKEEKKKVVNRKTKTLHVMCLAVIARLRRDTFRFHALWTTSQRISCSFSELRYVHLEFNSRKNRDI